MNVIERSMRLIGKVVVVTGSAVGLGRAVAMRFACEGAAVVAADINDRDGTTVVDKIKERGLEAVFVPTDVSDEGPAVRPMSAGMDKYDHIDVLYNNAAVFIGGQSRLVGLGYQKMLKVSPYFSPPTSPPIVRAAFICAMVD